MEDSPDEIEKLEQKRLRIRRFNVAWWIFLLSPFVILGIIWAPTWAVRNLEVFLQFLGHLPEEQ